MTPPALPPGPAQSAPQERPEPARSSSWPRLLSTEFAKGAARAAGTVLVGIAAIWWRHE